MGILGDIVGGIADIYTYKMAITMYEEKGDDRLFRRYVSKASNEKLMDIEHNCSYYRGLSIILHEEIAERRKNMRR